MKRKLVSILLTAAMVFSLAGCGAKTEAEVSGQTETESVAVEVQETSEVDAEVAEEQFIADSVKLAFQEAKYDEAIKMLDEAKADMETEEYALLMSNAYLYKEDYVAAADVLVEMISETDSQVLKERLDYIRDNTLDVERIGYDEEGNVSYLSKSEYDDAGRLLKTVGYDAEGNETGSSEYEYDDKGNPIKEVHNLGDGEFYISTMENMYKEDGSLVSVTTFNSEGVIETIEEYDDFGNVILKTMYMDGEEFSYYKYEYDERGRETSVEFAFMTGENGYIITYEYNDVNGITEKIGYDENGDVESYVELDQEGNIIYDDSIGLFTTEYKYNSLNDEVYYSMTGSGFDSANNIEYTYKFFSDIEE